MWTAEDYLAHSAKGTSWRKKDHKYVKKEGKRYFYSGPKYDLTKMTAPDDAISDEGVAMVTDKMNHEENPLKKMFNESDKQNRTNNFFENLTQSVKDALSAPIEAIGTAIKIKKGIDVVRGVWNGLYNSLPNFHTMVTRKVFK